MSSEPKPHYFASSSSGAKSKKKKKAPKPARYGVSQVFAKMVIDALNVKEKKVVGDDLESVKNAKRIWLEIADEKKKAVFVSGENKYPVFLITENMKEAWNVMVKYKEIKTKELYPIFLKSNKNKVVPF
jgi:hypothetical protein